MTRRRGRRARDPTRASVLVTGFVPFGRHRANPSEAVVRAFRAGPALVLRRAGIPVRTMILPVDSSAGGRVAREIAVHRPILAVHLGLKEGADRIRIETRAMNRLDDRTRDKRGRLLRGRRILRRGPPDAWSRAPIALLLGRLRRARIAAGPSRDAGSFICNQVLYRSLVARREHRAKGLSVFLHIPHIARLKEARVLEALRLVIEALIPTARLQGRSRVAPRGRIGTSRALHGPGRSSST